MSNQTREMEFSELSDNMNIKLINGLGVYISLIKNDTDNGKNLKIKPVDSSIQNKQLDFCFELSFRIL